ncbi:MAG: DUF2007 domain-containing protein [Planctomycetota bacterium]
MSSANELVTVKRLKDPVKAEIIKGALEEQGINCLLDGAGQAGLSGLLTIRIQVLESDRPQAEALLADFAEPADE